MLLQTGLAVSAYGAIQKLDYNDSLGKMGNGTNFVAKSESCNFTTFEFVGYFYVLTIVCAVGIILNIINIIVFSGKCFNATVYVYMSAISLTDGISLAATIPYGLVRCTGHLSFCSEPGFKRFRFAMSYYNSYLGFGLANIAEAASAWLTMLISIERYMAMKYPTLSTMYCRQESGKMHVLTVIMIAIAFNSPLFFSMRMSHEVHPFRVNGKSGNRTILVSKLTTFGDSVYYEVYTWVRFLCVQLFPLIGLCIFNTLLLQVVSESYKKLRLGQKASGSSTNYDGEYTKTLTSPEIKSVSLSLRKSYQVNTDSFERDTYAENDVTKQQRSVRQKQFDRRQRAQTKLTIMQICVIFLFLIGQIPQALSFEKISHVIMPASCGRCCSLRNYYRLCSQVLSLISYSLPFIIYVSLNRHFQEVLQSGCRSKGTTRQGVSSRSHIAT